VDEEGVEDFGPFFGEAAAQNIVVEPRLHDDDAWRAYL
jgi:hypothetical protein